LYITAVSFSISRKKKKKKGKPLLVLAQTPHAGARRTKVGAIGSRVSPGRCKVVESGGLEEEEVRSGSGKVKVGLGGK